MEEPPGVYKKKLSKKTQSFTQAMRQTTVEHLESTASSFVLPLRLCRCSRLPGSLNCFNAFMRKYLANVIQPIKGMHKLRGTCTSPYPPPLSLSLCKPHVLCVTGSKWRPANFGSSCRGRYRPQWRSWKQS